MGDAVDFLQIWKRNVAARKRIVYRKEIEEDFSTNYTNHYRENWIGENVCLQTKLFSFMIRLSDNTCIKYRVTVISCRRFGTTYRSHLQNNSLSQKMGTICCSETSIRNYYFSLCNDPEEYSSHLNSNEVYCF